MNDVENQQQRVRDFFQLLPVTVELAGLPQAEPGRYFTPEQMEARVITLRQAYKIAKALLQELTAT